MMTRSRRLGAALLAVGVCAGGVFADAGRAAADADRMRRSALALQTPLETVHPNAIRQHDLDRDGMVTLVEFVSSLERRFALLDVDRDRSLSLLELAAQERPAGADPRATFQRMDGNRDGMLSSTEFVSGSQDVFWRFDVDRDKVVTAAEIGSVIQAQQVLAQARSPALLRDRRRAEKEEEEREATGTPPGRTPIIVAIDRDEPRQKIVNFFANLNYRVIPATNEDELTVELFDPKVQIVIIGLPLRYGFRDYLCRLVDRRKNLYFNKPSSDSVLQHYTSDANLRSLADRIEKQLTDPGKPRPGARCTLPPASDRPY